MYFAQDRQTHRLFFPVVIWSAKLTFLLSGVVLCLLFTTSFLSTCSYLFTYTGFQSKPIVEAQLSLKSQNKVIGSGRDSLQNKVLNPDINPAFCHCSQPKRVSFSIFCWFFELISPVTVKTWKQVYDISAEVTLWGGKWSVSTKECMNSQLWCHDFVLPWTTPLVAKILKHDSSSTEQIHVFLRCGILVRLKQLVSVNLLSANWIFCEWQTQRRHIRQYLM